MKGPFDGTAASYVFGPPSLYYSHRKPWETAQTSLAKAIRAFRVSATFPHQYSTAPVKTQAMSHDGIHREVYLSSEPGAMVPIHVVCSEGGGRRFEHVGDIHPEGPEAEEYKGLFLPAMVSLLVPLAAVAWPLRGQQVGDGALRDMHELVRIDDKLSRLAKGPQAGEDAVLDLIGYLVLLRVIRGAK